MNTSVGTSTEWMQFYEQTVDELSAPSLGFSDATTATTSVSSRSNLCPGTSSLHSPKGCSSKPIRRQRRASKKTPATLLNANASNFRALVQQFTGCPTTPISTNRRGPINLNFALGSEHNQSGTATSIMPAAGNDYYYHQQSHQENASHQQQQQQQQHAVSFGNVDPEAFFSSSSRRANADQILEDFDLDNISLQAFNRDVPYSSENAYDGYYFL